MRSAYIKRENSRSATIDEHVQPYTKCSLYNKLGKQEYLNVVKLAFTRCC